eukprot:3708956-Rhodomonas_salina.1
MTGKGVCDDRKGGLRWQERGLEPADAEQLLVQPAPPLLCQLHHQPRHWHPARRQLHQQLELTRKQPEPGRPVAVNGAQGHTSPGTSTVTV